MEVKQAYLFASQPPEAFQNHPNFQSPLLEQEEKGIMLRTHFVEQVSSCALQAESAQHRKQLFEVSTNCVRNRVLGTEKASLSSRRT